MFIDKLLNAIYSKFTGTAALTTAFGSSPTRYYRDEAEGSPAMPYVVSEVVPGSPLTDAFANAISADVTVVFKVVCNGHNVSAGHMTTLITALDNTILTLSGGTNIGMYRQNEPHPTKLPEDDDGDDVWQWSVAYVYQIQ